MLPCTGPSGACLGISSTTATSFSGYFCIFLIRIGEAMGHRCHRAHGWLPTAQSSSVLWSVFVVLAVMNKVQLSQPLSRVTALKTHCCCQLVSLYPSLCPRKLRASKVLVDYVLQAIGLGHFGLFLRSCASPVALPCTPLCGTVGSRPME